MTTVSKDWASVQKNKKQTKGTAFHVTGDVKRWRKYGRRKYSKPLATSPHLSRDVNTRWSNEKAERLAAALGYPGSYRGLDTPKYLC